MSYAAPDSPRGWVAFGFVDLDAGTARLKMTTPSGTVFRQLYVDGDAVHQRVLDEEGPWREVRAPDDEADDLVGRLFGLLELPGAVVSWRPLDSDRAPRPQSAFRGRLRRRIGRRRSGVLPIVFMDMLPLALVRRRFLDVHIDEDGRVHRLRITARKLVGFGGRVQRLQLNLSDFGGVRVDPIDGRSDSSRARA